MKIYEVIIFVFVILCIIGFLFMFIYSYYEYDKALETCEEKNMTSYKTLNIFPIHYKCLGDDGMIYTYSIEKTLSKGDDVR